MLKFRSMRRDAEAIAAKIEEHKILATQGSFDRPEDASVLKLRHTLQKLTPSDKYHRDPRILPFGSFMRRYSIDELPQLFHIISGEMSLVGPRPLAAWEVADFTPRDMLRHKIKPGITGWAQVNGARGETETIEKMQQRVELDHQYIREWSLWLDIKIMFRTIFVVLSAKNAY